MKKIDLSSLNIDEYFNSIDSNKIEQALKKLRPRTKYKNIIDNLEAIIKADLTEIETQFKNFSNRLSKKEKKKVEEIFNYSGYRKKPNFMKHFKKLNIKSCPFCNNNYVYFYEQGAKEYNTLATLEHYYPKVKYPHLSLSFYNLIPSCSVCNSKFRGSGELVGQIAHPYFDDFDTNVEFWVSVDSMDIAKDIELDIKIKSYNKKCNASIERFKLDKIYKQHNDIAKEIWNKAQLYNESRIEELHKEFYAKLDYTKEDVKNMIFCNYLNRDDINKRNHSKLTQDILKQWNLQNDSKQSVG